MEKTSFGIPEQKGNVTVYPAVSAETLRAARGHKTRAAAYVRVSTDSIQQETSLVLQKEYYENFIKNNSEYEFVEVYGDEGISGTCADKRKGFQKMLKDCKAGKIDLILVKSISRFARNVVDLLTAINNLNALNPPVEIRFEVENVSTFSQMGKMLITVLGILAEWESQVKSEAITWAIDKLFAQGKYYVSPIYGYTKEKGRNNPLVVNEDESKIVCLCFAMTIEGYSPAKILNTLKTLDVKGRKWSTGGILSLLSNEKYAGELRARKTVTPNYITHKAKKNEGEKPQYYVTEHHEPIVSPLAYSVTQKIIKNRRCNNDGIPYLKAVPEGVLKGFVVVNKALRGYTLNDYVEASYSVYKEEGDDSEISIIANEISIFDLRTYNIVSALLFEDPMKSSCLIKDNKITFNAACRKALGAEKAEILFHPTNAILAVRSPVNEKMEAVTLSKPIHLPAFVPVALESAGLKTGYRYCMYGTKRTKNGESVIFFDLRDNKIISKEKGGYILPDKYVERFGNGYYETLTAHNQHKIDKGELWQASQESVPADSLAEQVVELAGFCQNSLAEFDIRV